MIKVNLVAGMDCDKCGRPALLFQKYSGLHLCSLHFQEDLLHKAKKTIRHFKWLRPGDRLAVSLSGGQVDAVLLYFVHQLIQGRRDVTIFGLSGYDKNSQATGWVNILTKALGTDLVVAGKKGGKPGWDHMVAEPCTSPEERFFSRRTETEQYLSCIAKSHGATGLVVPYDLEDHAEWVLWKAISGNAGLTTGKTPANRAGFRVIRPFMHIPENELKLYAGVVAEQLHIRLPGSTSSGPGGTPLRGMIKEFSARHPGAPFALVNIGIELNDKRGQPGTKIPAHKGSGYGSDALEKMHHGS